MERMTGGGACLLTVPLHEPCLLVPASPACRIHFVFCYLNMGWACWLILEYYKVRTGLGGTCGQQG